MHNMISNNGHLLAWVYYDNKVVVIVNHETKFVTRQKLADIIREWRNK